jgi:hypothetical protein
VISWCPIHISGLAAFLKWPGPRFGRPMIAVQSEVKTLDMSKLFALAAKQAAAAPAPPTSAAGPIVDAEIVEVTEPARVMKECAKTIDGTKTPATTIDGTEPIDGAVIEQAAIDREEEGIEW